MDQEIKITLQDKDTPRIVILTDGDTFKIVTDLPSVKVAYLQRAEDDTYSGSKYLVLANEEMKPQLDEIFGKHPWVDNTGDPRILSEEQSRVGVEKDEANPESFYSEG